MISIHSLLAEGDSRCYFINDWSYISIHSLLAEGDARPMWTSRAADEFQSTPSSRRETLSCAILRMHSRISIHSLLAEGDAYRHAQRQQGALFQSTPSSRRETHMSSARPCAKSFQSTPSSRRETTARLPKDKALVISIHSLLAEGDARHVNDSAQELDFNPLPPRGGRRKPPAKLTCGWKFQSTPSSRRET